MAVVEQVRFSIFSHQEIQELQNDVMQIEELAERKRTDSYYDAPTMCIVTGSTAAITFMIFSIAMGKAYDAIIANMYPLMWTIEQLAR